MPLVYHNCNTDLDYQIENEKKKDEDKLKLTAEDSLANQPHYVVFWARHFTLTVPLPNQE